MPKDTFDYKYELLLKEIDILQGGIRGYDSILFTIKGWSITIFSAFIFFVAKEDEALYLILAAIAVILFWALDAINKGFQRAFIIRHNRIEHYLRTDFTEDIVSRKMRLNVPDIGARVSVRDRNRKISPWRSALYIHTAGLYVAMLVILAIMAFIGLWPTSESTAQVFTAATPLSSP